MTLTAEQAARAVEAMQAYLDAAGSEGVSPAKRIERDKDLGDIIEQQLKPLLSTYLEGKTPLDEFKSRIDGINKKHRNWGFRGAKGQMFFNMVVNVASEAVECDQELKAALAMPADEDEARGRLNRFADYVSRIGNDFVDGGGSKHGRPRIGSVPYFLSYFWQVQDRFTWPMYYTNSVKTMGSLGLWRPTGDLAEDYIAFKRLHEELVELFTKESGLFKIPCG